MKLPELSEEQAAALLAKKKEWAEGEGKGKGQTEGACTNLKCRCVECTCGSGCTCNISPEVNCDPCKDFKKAMVAKTDAGKLSEAAAMYDEVIRPKCSELTHVSAAEVVALIEKASPEVLLVDVRKEAERNVSTIPGAVSSEALEADVKGLAAGKLVIPFCTIGGRSGTYCQKLSEMAEKPWTEIKNFELSLIGWCHNGGKLVDPQGNPTLKVHPGFNPRAAGAFPVAFEIVQPESA